MFQQRATLIQDIREYLEIILPYLRPLLEQYAHSGIDEESAVLWLISEELELTHCLAVRDHYHDREPHLRILDGLRGSLPYDFSILTGQYVKAPRLYNDDNEIEVSLNARDLYIKYYASPPPFVQYIPTL